MLETLQIEPKKTATHAIIWLHGLGADGYDFEPIVPELRLGEHQIRFIFPHAPIQAVTINGGMHMRAWYDIKDLNALDNEDVDGIKHSSEKIINIIHEQNKRGIASDKIFLIGFSQGGAIALYTGLRYSQTLAGIIALSSYLPAQVSLEHERQPANQQTPVLVMHGLTDPVIPIQAARITKESLEALKYPLDYKEYPMMHQVCPEQIFDLHTWFMRHLSHSAQG